MYRYFQMYSIPQRRIDTKRNIPIRKEQGLTLFLFSIPYENRLCMSAVPESFPRTLQGPALTRGLAYPFIPIGSWICSVCTALPLVVW